MGVDITIKEANYTNNIGKVLIFDILSNSINIKYSNNLLTLRNGSTPTLYEFGGSKRVKSALLKTISIPTTRLFNSVVIGTTVDKNAVVLYLNNTGSIAIFDKSGTGPTVIYTIPTGKPNIPLNSEFTISHGTTELTITYPAISYTKTVLYSDISALVNKGIGFLATGLSGGAVDCEYYLEPILFN